MDIVERCSNYLSSGGLFNPEFADHDAVRDLVINCRDEIERLRNGLEHIVEIYDHHVKTYDHVPSNVYLMAKIARETLKEKE